MTIIYEYNDTGKKLMDANSFEQLMAWYPDTVLKFKSKDIFTDAWVDDPVGPGPTKNPNQMFLEDNLTTVYGLFITEKIMIVPERNYNASYYDEIHKKNRPMEVFPMVAPSDYPIDRTYLKPRLPCFEDQKRFVAVCISWCKDLNNDREGKEFIDLLDTTEPLPGIFNVDEKTDDYKKRTVIKDDDGVDRRINIVIYGPGPSRGEYEASPRAFAEHKSWSYSSSGRGTASNIAVDPYVTGAMEGNKLDLGVVGFFHECIHAYHFLVGKGIPAEYKGQKMQQNIQYRSKYTTDIKRDVISFEEIMTTGGEDPKKIDVTKKNTLDDYYIQVQKAREGLAESYEKDSDPRNEENKKYGPGGSEYEEDLYKRWMTESKDPLQKKWDEQKIVKILGLSFRKSYLNQVYVPFNCGTKKVAKLYTDVKPTHLTKKKQKAQDHKE